MGIELLNGVLFDFNHPESFNCPIEDMAWALSNLCRFSGHVAYFYPVSQHLVNTSIIADPACCFEALMHDVPEALTGDVTTPMKRAIPGYYEFEEKIEKAVAGYCGYHYPLPVAVHLADKQMLRIEIEHLKPDRKPEHWAFLDSVPRAVNEGEVFMDPRTPDEAFTLFMNVYYDAR